MQLILALLVVLLLAVSVSSQMSKTDGTLATAGVDYAAPGGSSGGALVAMADLSVTMTNIGTAYKDIYSAAFQPDFHSIDFTNFTSCRMLAVWDYVGVGTQQVRLADAADNVNVLIEGATFTADCDPCDTGWVAIPAAFQNATKTIEWQGKSTTSTDDPVAKGFRLYCK